MFEFFKNSWNSKIRNRLVMYYIVFTVLAVVLITYLTYTQAAQSLRQTVEYKLDTVAAVKVDTLNRWVDEQQGTAVFLASLPQLRSLTSLMLDPLSSPQEQASAQQELTRLVNLFAQRTSDFRDIQILDLRGMIVVSVSPGNVGVSQANQPFFEEGQQYTFVQNFYESDQFSGTTLTIAAPLFDSDNQRVGVLALHFNMKRLDAILRESDGQSEGMQAYLITASRRMITSDSIIPSESPILTSSAIDAALEGGAGKAEYINHRGVAVIGNYRWIGERNAALVIEIDEETALWPARHLAGDVAVIVILFSIGLVVVVTIMAGRITAPLSAFTRTVAHISEGDFNASAPVLSDDEVGVLAQTLNAMTAKLRQTLEGLEKELHDRKQAEGALRDSEQKFRTVFEASPIAICITALDDGRMLEANYAYWDLMGYDPQTSIGKTAEELRLREPSEARAQFVQSLKHKGSLYNPDDEFETKNGKRVQAISFYRLVQIGGEERIISMFYDMSAQKQTMQALQQSEGRVRVLLEAIPDMIVELSRDGLAINVIPPKGMEGPMPANQFIGRRIDEVLSETAASQTLLAMRRSLESGQITMFEFIERMDQVDRTMEARVVPNSADTVIMMIRDITQRKWVETEREKLINELEIKNRESETLRESLASIVTTFNLKQTMELVLDQIKLVIPYDTASVWRLEGNWQTLLIERDLPPEIPMESLKFKIDEDNSSRPIIRGEKPYVLSNNVQVELRDFKGPHSYINSWLAVPLKTRGKIIGLIALDGRHKNQFDEHHAELAVTFADQVAIALENADLFSSLQTELDERKKLIQELEEKNRESETLRESVAIVAATLEKRDTVDRILEQLERVVPYDSASVQLVEGNKLRIVSEKGFTLNESDVGIPIDENEPTYPVLLGEVPYILFDDVQLHSSAFSEAPHDRIHAWMAIPLKMKGKVIGVITLDGYRAGQFTDRHARLAVTYASQVAIALENTRLYSDLQAELSTRQTLISELETKNAELERFTYTVSHDLKSPLFTIRGFLGYLKQDALAGNRERLNSDIQRITDATEKMQQLLNDLLELSRIGRLMNEPVPIQFGELVSEAVALVHGRIMEIGAAVHIDASLPVVYGDRPRLIEIVQNLVENAAKFMGPQPNPRIEIGMEGEEDGKPILYVRDNGMGIPPEHHDRIFGLFNKLDVKVDGTGIGLTLVKRIVEVHGGRIWVRSAAGEGATFLFTLPSPPIDHQLPTASDI